MHELDMAGVTVTRGIEGYGQGKRIHSARVFELSLKLPVIVEIIDTVEKIERAIPVLDSMVNEGLILTTEVEVIKYGKESKLSQQ
jgi:PII-like signaling protein